MKVMTYKILLKPHNWKQKKERKMRESHSFFFSHTADCCTGQELSPVKHFPPQNRAKARRKHAQTTKAIAHESNLSIIINKLL